jgi:queuine/archaeosine tRNA-ribosyltransferase
MEPEIRKMPKKTVMLLTGMVILGILSFFAVIYGKTVKATKILTKLGYKNIANVHIYSTQEFLNETTNIKGMQYKVSFNDLDKNQECRGFIVRDLKNNVDKDLDCK